MVSLPAATAVVLFNLSHALRVPATLPTPGQLLAAPIHPARTRPSSRRERIHVHAALAAHRWRLVPVPLNELTLNGTECSAAPDAVMLIGGPIPLNGSALFRVGLLKLSKGDFVFIYYGSVESRRRRQ